MSTNVSLISCLPLSKTKWHPSFPEPFTHSQSPRNPSAHSFADNILAPFGSHPHLVHLPRIDVYPVARGIRLLHGLLVMGEGNGETATEDEVRGQAGVGVRGVVCVAVRCVS